MKSKRARTTTRQLEAKELLRSLKEKNKKGVLYQSFEIQGVKVRIREYNGKFFANYRIPQFMTAKDFEEWLKDTTELRKDLIKNLV